MIWLVAIELITLHMVDGREVQINPDQVTHLMSATAETNKVLAEGVRCLVRLTDGQFVSVAEECSVVRELIEGEER